MVLLGPSGCGKTTLLRMIAGLEYPDSGSILIGGRDVTDLPPRSRDIAMVFQSYAVFPHMKVRDNIAFGLRMHHVTKAEITRKVGQAAEAKRKQTFERWSGPPGGAWSPKCEVVLHPSAECYAKMTGKPAAGSGHATVRLAEGKVTARRIDLRADDDGLTADALPRELTHVILADLFPFTPPPKWAEEGMAVLATSPEEIGRYTRTLARCARGGELYTLAVLLEMKDFPPAEKITGFYCGSVSLAGYLVKLKGEKQFTLFLRDCQRYGATQALKRQYDFESPKALQDAWLRAALEVARGQAP